jgi:RNA polymerase sigma-70 factor (ECF subfamily)
MTTKDYNECVNDYGDGIYRFLHKLLDCSQAAKDLTQDSFLKLWENKELIDKTKIKAWLFKTAYNAFIDNERHNKFNAKTNNLTDLQCEKVENDFSDIKSILENALSYLPDVQRSVVLLRDYEGYSYEEIGEMLSLSEAQVKVYIFRARTTLKKMIGKIENII